MKLKCRFIPGVLKVSTVVRLMSTYSYYKSMYENLA